MNDQMPSKQNSIEISGSLIKVSGNPTGYDFAVQYSPSPPGLEHRLVSIRIPDAQVDLIFSGKNLWTLTDGGPAGKYFEFSIPVEYLNDVLYIFKNAQIVSLSIHYDDTTKKISNFNINIAKPKP